MKCSCFVLKITECCNLACKYCYMFRGGDFSFKHKPKLMSIEIAHKAILRAKEHCLKHKLKNFNFLSVAVFLVLFFRFLSLFFKSVCQFISQVHFLNLFVKLIKFLLIFYFFIFLFFYFSKFCKKLFPFSGILVLK